MLSGELLLLLLRRKKLLTLLLLEDGLLLLGSHGGHVDARLWSDHAHIGVLSILDGHARLAGLAGLLHEVRGMMGHGWRCVCWMDNRRMGQGHGLLNEKKCISLNTYVRVMFHHANSRLSPGPRLNTPS